MLRSVDTRRPVFIPRLALIGLVGGIAIGIVARICGESAWWWLAVPIAPLFFGFNRDDSSPEPVATRRNNTDIAYRSQSMPSSPDGSSVGEAGAPSAGKSASARLNERDRANIAEFQERRREAGRRIRPSAIAMVGGFAVLFFCRGVPETAGLFSVCLLAFVMAVAAIIHMTFVWKRFYRCPACEEPLLNRWSQGGDVPLNPRACPNCGARLA